MRRAGQEAALLLVLQQAAPRQGWMYCSLPTLFLPREELGRCSLLRNTDEHSNAENTQHKMFLFFPSSGKKVMSQMTLLKKGKTLVY